MAIVQENNKNQKDTDEVSIDLQLLLQNVILHKWRVLLFAFIFAILGALYSLTSPNEYVSTV